MDADKKMVRTEQVGLQTKRMHTRGKVQRGGGSVERRDSGGRNLE